MSQMNPKKNFSVQLPCIDGHLLMIVSKIKQFKLQGFIGIVTVIEYQIDQLQKNKKDSYKMEGNMSRKKNITGLLTEYKKASSII